MILLADFVKYFDVFSGGDIWLLLLRSIGVLSFSGKAVVDDEGRLVYIQVMSRRQLLLLKAASSWWLNLSSLRL